MKRGTTFFLKTTVFLIGIMILLLSAFFLPWLASYTASMYPEFAYLQYPVLIGMYVTAIPFFFALYQALKLLNYIDHGKAFTDQSLEALNSIKYCAILISGLYVIGTIFSYFAKLPPPKCSNYRIYNYIYFCCYCGFCSGSSKLFKNALVIKSENDLTV